MAWDHLDVDKPHVAYMILGGFTSLFMLCSLFVKERLYIGEATVATLCGVIFGPHAANLFDPISWGNVDKLTLECSRIVLVVQCFAIGVELPKSYMNRHWKSVVLLLLPVMTWGWLITSLFIWWMVPPLSWLESLACAACVTATDPVLASSVVGKGKFAKRVPKHLRDLLSAESGCNDGMAFPFIYLAVYLMEYRPDSQAVAMHWICFTILYECIAGAIFGFSIGYIGRHAIKYAERKSLIDRESFLVFYFVLALFCAGSGSLLGMDDLLIGFAAGVGFSNDGWFTEKTEESHVSNVIDLLLNLAYFVYFGAIIPWEQYNAPELGLVPWRLVVIAIFVIFFRRLPIMLALKPFIPDVKTWREALFAGHFGPIGVGAIFAAILTRAELETGSTQPLAVLPKPGEHNYMIVALIWPITTFMVISSIIVHGSSIAVFTLGKRINTLTITMSYTQDEGPSWMNRLPRIQSQSKASLSLRKESMESEKLPEFPPGTLGPLGVAGNFLRRQRDDAESEPSSRASSRKPTRRRRMGAGGPISQSAITPQRRTEVTSPVEGDIMDENKPPRKTSPSSEGSPTYEELNGEEGELVREPELEIYREGNKMIIEDEEGNVLDTANIKDMSPEEQKERIIQQHRRVHEDRSGEVANSKDQPHERSEGEDIEAAVGDKALHPYQNIKKHLSSWAGVGKGKEKEPKSSQKEGGRRSARAYQFGNTIIVEDADGEVIKKYTIPHPEKQLKDVEATASGANEAKPSPSGEPIRRRMSRVGTWIGLGEGKEAGGEASSKKPTHAQDGDDSSDDDRLRFTVTRPDVMGTAIGRRMSKNDFIKQIQQLDPKARTELLHHSSTPEQIKAAFRKDPSSRQYVRRSPRSESPLNPTSPQEEQPSPVIPAENNDVPTHDISASLAQYSAHKSSAAEARRRRLAGEPPSITPSPSSSIRGRARRDSDDDGTERVPPSQRRQQLAASGFPFPSTTSTSKVAAGAGETDTGETPAERKRRLAVLGELRDPADDDDDDNEEDYEEGSESPGGTRMVRSRRVRGAVVESDSEDDGMPRAVKGKVQFADGTAPAKKKGDAGEVGEVGTAPVAGAGNAGSGSGSGSWQRGHTPRVSWGGERGRNV
ncbi:hypothetical protein FQN51_003911 [Onygenales sp. PD_10]|nr:hypothetical protein FQN51_003911 [Onygenales sp. PD_10]